MRVLKIFKVFCRLKKQEILDPIVSVIGIIFEDFCGAPARIKLFLIGFVEIVVAVIIFLFYLSTNIGYLETVADIMLFGGLLLITTSLYCWIHLLIIKPICIWLKSNWKKATKIVEDNERL